MGGQSGPGGRGQGEAAGRRVMMVLGRGLRRVVGRISKEVKLALREQTKRLHYFFLEGNSFMQFQDISHEHQYSMSSIS